MDLVCLYCILFANCEVWRRYCCCCCCCWFTEFELVRRILVKKRCTFTDWIGDWRTAAVVALAEERESAACMFWMCMLMRGLCCCCSAKSPSTCGARAPPALVQLWFLMSWELISPVEWVDDTEFFSLATEKGKNAKMKKFRGGDEKFIKTDICLLSPGLWLLGFVVLVLAKSLNWQYTKQHSKYGYFQSAQ